MNESQPAFGFGEPPRSWFKCSRSQDAWELALGFPNAFRLLWMIAYRAQRTAGFNRYQLQPGEALLGDFARCGFSEQEYRTAKAQLEGWGFATFKGTARGTIATLSNTLIFDINAESPILPRTEPRTEQRAEQRTDEQRNPQEHQQLTAAQPAQATDSPTNGATVAPTNEQRTPNGRPTTTKNAKNAKTSFITPARGGSRKQPKYSPEVHERAIELHDSWRDCWAQEMDGSPLDLDFQRDARALHSLAGMSGANGGLLPISGILEVARWAWAQHKETLRNGRTDFVLEQSLTPLRFSARFAELQIRKQNGFRPNGANGHGLDKAKANMADTLQRQRTSQRIALDKIIAEDEARLEELRHELSLSIVKDRDKKREDLKAIKERLAVAKEDRRRLTLGSSQGDETKRNETTNEAK